MSYAPSSQGFSLFPTAPSAPHAFTIFSLSQSPRETHVLYGDLTSVFRSSTACERRGALQPSSGCEKSVKRSKSTPSFKMTWRKLFRLESPEPDFEFVTSEDGKLATPPNEEDAESSDGSVTEDDFGILGSPMSKKLEAYAVEDDGESSDGTLVGEEPVIIVTDTSLNADQRLVGTTHNQITSWF